MEWLGTLFLYLHISSVIIGFGPSIAFPFFGAKAAEEPEHGNFVLRVTKWTSDKVVEPVAAFVFLTGVGLILARGYNPLEQLWVGVAIVLFIITFAYANLGQAAIVRKMIALTEGPPPADAPPGPPPGFVELSQRAARGGMFMTLMIFVILFLMVFKPF